MQKGELLYSGKAKSLFATKDNDQVIVEFRDDATAFDGAKKAALSEKGATNNAFNVHFMTLLGQHDIKTHFVEKIDATHSLFKRLEMIPIECVVRNVAAGSLCIRYGIEEGVNFSPAEFEFFLKNDELHDPLINRSHIITLGYATDAELDQLQTLTLKVNDVLLTEFDKAGLQLVDFKLEFGRHGDELVLGDEISPDGCRIWDKNTQDKLDKDRFRQDLGDVIESYQVAAKRLGVAV